MRMIWTYFGVISFAYILVYKLLPILEGDR